MINLLPQQQEEELKLEEKWKLTLILGIIFLVFLLCLFLIILSIKIYISGELGFQKELQKIEEKKFETPETKEFQQKIVALNKTFLKLDSFYQEQPNLTEVLEKIYTTLPSGVSLTRLSWQKDTSQFDLFGFVPLREDLFTLKENLEKEKDFGDIYFPPANWVKPKEIDFHVTFKVK